MGGVVQSGNRNHDTACLAAEVTRQAAVAGLGTGPAAQVTLDNAERAYHRSVIASAKANNSSSGVEASLSALRALGVNS
jgi:hypothetical protein